MRTVEGFREALIGGTGVALNDPRVNMLYDDLTRAFLPPVLVYYGEHEVLVGRSQSSFARRAKDAGVDVTTALRARRPAQFHPRCRAVCPRWTVRSRRLAVVLRSRLGVAALAAA